MFLATAWIVQGYHTVLSWVVACSTDVVPPLQSTGRRSCCTEAVCLYLVPFSFKVDNTRKFSIFGLLGKLAQNDIIILRIRIKNWELRTSISAPVCQISSKSDRQRQKHDVMSIFMMVDQYWVLWKAYVGLRRGRQKDHRSKLLSFF